MPSSCWRTLSGTWKWARSRWQAALVGSREIGFTIVSMTLSLAAVFIPVLFMGGILGRLFREFAVTICVAILISGRGLGDADADAVQPVSKGSETRGAWLVLSRHRAFFNGMLRAYDLTLQIVLRHWPATMVGGVLVLAGTCTCSSSFPKVHPGSGHRSAC